MSTFDELPEDIREWLRENRPGARINVPKEFSAKERADRLARIRSAYDSGIAAGADRGRLMRGLAAEFGMELSGLYKLLFGKTGSDSKIL